MTTLLDKIKGKRQEIKESRAAMTRAYKFKQGKTVISLLPLHADLDKPVAEQAFWREFGQHFIKNKKGEMIVAVGDRSICFPGEECPVRDGLVDMIRYGNSIGDDDLVKTAKESLAKKSYLVNIMVHQDPDKKKEDEPQLASFSETLFDSFGSVLEEYLTAGADDLLRWNERLMFVVERTGSGKNDTRYTIMPLPKKISVDKAVMAKAVNLEEYVQGQFSDSTNKALAYISTALGRPISGTAFATALTAAPGKAATAALPPAPVDPAGAEDLLADAPSAPASGAPALDRTRAVDAEFTEAAPAPVPAGAEDLLAELDGLAA